MLLEFYIKYRTFVHKMRSYLRFFEFMKFVWVEKVFKSSDSVDALKVLCKYLELQHTEYDNKIVMNRDLKRSFLLFKSLTKSYLETKSPVTLNQLLAVLKQEFIERGN